VLGPVLFIPYATDLCSQIENHGLSSHVYADDTQVYGTRRPNAVDALSRKSECVSNIAGWIKSYRLQLISNKTEVLWCATVRRQHQSPTASLSTDGFQVAPVLSVRDLGIYDDADLVMRTQVLQRVSRCFATLRQLRQIRHSFPAATFQTLVVTLVIPRLKNGNGVLVGNPAYLVRRLQSVLNASARLICNLHRSDHVTDALSLV
jgi:hypothetical protein